MRALTMDEVGFVSGGTTRKEIDYYIATASQNGTGTGGGGGGSNGGSGNPFEALGKVAQNVAEKVVEAIMSDASRVINGSDPEGDSKMADALARRNGLTLGKKGTIGNWNYWTINARDGTYVLLDHQFNGLGSWDRVVFVSNGGGALTWHPGGAGGNDGYH